MPTFALGFGTATKNRDNKIIEVFFPHPLLNPSDDLVAVIGAMIGYQGGNKSHEVAADIAEQLSAAFYGQNDDSNANFTQAASCSSQPLVLTILEIDSAPKTVPEAYLKLQLISHRLVKPHDLVLDGIFNVLHNIAWTNKGAIDLPELAQHQIEARLKGETINVTCVDKFPKMVDYVVPIGVRIADTSRVRLGAYVGNGTTVMHEGFINFNAGTAGVSMVEGRISAGVMVAHKSDIGGGASIMGTLSGGGEMVISIGEACLLGANSGLGIPLGDRCTIEAGLYVTAGSKIKLLDKEGKEAGFLKASELANKNDLLFRRNSMTGEIECLVNKSTVELNNMLHCN